MIVAAKRTIQRQFWVRGLIVVFYLVYRACFLVNIKMPMNKKSHKNPSKALGEL